ncbi:hypothetical protein BEWA_011030 [Theileria equi strain WA]|uniref:Uncharacterized protein n=1 Tax=Theileria equi strain WA TaxID=1537102 RepID=L0B1H9_THEEQ|nr:hypothetical protein BEWA_011030 [Theileria equi strain WA]AFZ81685.1 hypothetical protein BEWA_011030 [Theileria equi strain WA]|eukprot:XP_004831351.1 hypothetical protein BEWA_011030 [Theileria equi strain WA]
MIKDPPLECCNESYTLPCKLDNNYEGDIAKYTSSISTVCQHDVEALSHTHSLDDHVDINQSEATDDSGGPFTGHDPYLQLDDSVKRLEKRLKNGIMLNSVLDELCSIERKYIEQLRTLRNRINLSHTLESTGALAAFSALKSYITRVAENHNDFLDAVSNDCRLSDEHFERFTDINDNICTIKRELSDYEGKRTLCINEVENAFLHVKKALLTSSDSTYQVPPVKIKVHKSLISLLTNFFDLNSKARATDLEFKSSMAKLDEKVDCTISSLGSLDRARLIDIRDVLCKFMIYETAKIRNLQYDLSALIATLNDFDPSTDIEEFSTYRNDDLKKYNGSDMFRIARNYVRNFKFTTPELFHYNPQFTNTLRPPPDRVIHKIEGKLERFVTAIWDSKIENLSIKELFGEIHSSLVREIFCKLIANRSRRSGELKSMECLKTLGKVISMVLTISERQADSWCGYVILGFSDVIYSSTKGLDGSSENVHLRSIVYSHSYWNRISFWEECLTIIISFDLKTNFEMLSDLQFHRTYELKPITEESLSFYSWILNYGIPQNASKELILRVCGKLKLSESYAKSLLN